MKRLAALVLSLVIIVLSFAGCAETKLTDSQISKLLEEAFSNIETLQNINAKSYTEISYDFGSYAYTSQTESTIRESNIGEKDKYEMSTDVVVKSLGSESTYETYYKDGYYYSTRYGGNFKTKLSLDDVQSQSSVSLVKVSFDDMKTVATRTVEDSSSGDEGKYTYINFSCKNKVLRKYMQESFENSNGNIESATISGSDGQYVINEDGYIVSEKLSVSAKINVNGEETESVIAVKTVFSDIGEEVNPYDPEDSEYTDVENLENVIQLNSAMTKVFASDFLDMEMEIETEVEQDKTLSGYKRNYKRKLSTDQESFLQEVSTAYGDGKEYGEEYVSRQYFTDGTYYSGSDMTNIKLKSNLEFKEFYATIYAASAKTPAAIYVTGMMRDIKTEKVKSDTVYTFNLNPKTAEGVAFLQSLFGPYEQFGGDCEAAETVVNNFVGKSYVNKDGEYYKTVMECDLLIKFQEGDVKVKSQQTIIVNSTNKNEIKFSFPKLEGYEKWDKADLLSAYA